jgi:hypothetical protein
MQLPRSRVHEISQRMDDISSIFPLFTINYTKKKFVEGFTLHCYLFSCKMKWTINGRQSMLGLMVYVNICLYVLRTLT